MSRYQVRIETGFAAAHAIVINGARETLHGHDWRVVVTVGADQLDDDGLVCDFVALLAMLEKIVTPFRNANLNDTPPFDQINPTAEHVAQHIGERLGSLLDKAVRLDRVEVSEAPGCVAVVSRSM